jgi:poly(3-hydroxybutyrate) depolymerase
MKTRNLYPLATIICILLNVANISAQSDGYENRYIESQDPIPFDSFRYGLFVPPDYDSTVGHHLMLWLHGANYTADDDYSWYQPEWQEQYPTIVLTPKCYKSQYDDQRTELLRGAWGDSWVMVERWCIEMAFQALDSILREYNIDTTKMHIAGGSLGAVGTLYVLASRPGMFASAYAESTAADPEKADLLKDTPLWLFHGSDDPTIPAWQSRNMYHALRDVGGRVVRYKEYRGIGHNIWDYTPLENTLDDWLFAQKLGSVHEAPKEAVDNFSVTLNEDIKPVLSWTAPGDGIGEDEYIWAYQIYRDADLLETVDRDSLQFIDLDAEPNITYSYSVAPINYYFLEAPVSKIIAVITKKLIGDNIINVPDDFTKIQDAINSSVDGDTIIVAPGTYYENVNFRGKNVLLSSHYLFYEDISFINNTIIDGSKPQSPDTASVVVFLSKENRKAILQGFTITGGKGTKLLDQEDHYYVRLGGGVLTYHSSPTIRHNIIAFNESINPAGVRFKGGGGISANFSNAIISNNIIYKNNATDGGGAILGKNPYAIFRNNIVAYNTTIPNNYGGGGLFIRGSQGKFINNTIAFNNSAGGGGIMIWNSPTVNIENCIIYGNTSGSSYICSPRATRRRTRSSSCQSKGANRYHLALSFSGIHAFLG